MISNSSLAGSPHLPCALWVGAATTLQGREGLARTTDFGVMLAKSLASPPCQLENRNNTILLPYRGFLINASSFQKVFEFYLVLLIQLAKVDRQKLMGIPSANRIICFGDAEHSAAQSSHLHRIKRAGLNCLHHS